MLSWMNVLKRIWLVFSAFLVLTSIACTKQTMNTPTLTPTAVAPMVLPTLTPQPPYKYLVVSGDTCTSIAAAFDVSVRDLMSLNNLPLDCPLGVNQILFIPYSSVSPIRSSATPLPLPTALSKFPLDGYVMLFSRDGDLYFQDGENRPVKLTHISETPYTSYKISDDNRKVALGLASSIDGFSYSMNTDGTQQKPILPITWNNDVLWGTRLGNVYFVPGTHRLLFSAYVCNSYDRPTACVSSIYLTNADTGQNQKLADLGFSGAPAQEIFKVSPDGKLVAIATTNAVDIIDMEGKVVRQDILPFKPNTPHILFPSVFWLPDSSGLIVALPNTLFASVAYNYVPAYTIWRYTLDGDIATQIKLNPSPMALGDSGEGIQVSPDGKWIVYGGLGYNPEVYLGNLTNGQTQIYGEAEQAHFSWFPDSQHFLVTSASSVIGTIGIPGLKYGNSCYQWVDGSHLLCPLMQNINGLGMTEITSDGLKIYDLGFDPKVKLLLIKPK